MKVLLSILVGLNLAASIFIIIKQKSIMAKIDDINALVQGINDSTNNIAADLERIAGGLTGGLTAAEADSVIAELQAAADKLKAVADINPEP